MCKLGLLVAAFCLCKARFSPRVVHLRSVLKVVLRQLVLQARHFSPTICFTSALLVAVHGG